MKLVVDVSDEEYKSYKFLLNSGMGSAAIRKIINGEPYEEGDKTAPISKGMTPEEVLQWLHVIYVQIHVCSLESTFADECKAIALTEAIECYKEHHKRKENNKK